MANTAGPLRKEETKLWELELGEDCWWGPSAKGLMGV